jgi:hypothetical protein
MSVTPDQPAPYAPASAVIDIVERYRTRGLPTPINGDVLARAGTSESLIPRTIQALQSLDLITAEGMPSQVLEGIRLAPEAEYQQRLLDWLHATYADALQFVDPATADENAVRDAFRNYKPIGQQGRMVSLFTGLFKAAGVAPEKASSGAPRKKAPIALKKVHPFKKPKPKVEQAPDLNGVNTMSFDGALPPAISGLLASLPMHGEGWTKAQREAFMTTFGVVLDFCFPPGVVKAPLVTVEGDDAPEA